MLGPWYWANWIVVLACLMAGVMVSVLGRRLPPFWQIVNVLAIALYLGSSLGTVMSSIQLEQDIVPAGLQLGFALAMLVLNSYRLHLLGVVVFVAGSAGMAVFRIAVAVAQPMTAQDMGILMLDAVSVAFLAVLWPHVHAELRYVGLASQRREIRQTAESMVRS